MLARYTERNKYGGYTWHIKIDNFFNIFINSTNKDSFVVDFKEWKWISYKIRFSFISSESLTDTIKESFERVAEYFRIKKDIIWTDEQKNNFLNETLDLLKTSPDSVTTSLLNIASTANSIIKIQRGVSIDNNIINLTTVQMINNKYGSPHDIINHNNYSFELKYPNLGLSFSYKYNDPLKRIHYMKVTGEVPAETETGLKFDKELNMEKVISHYGIGKPMGSDDSEEAYMKYPGIQFYANKNDLCDLNADEIFVKYIAIFQM